MEKTTRNTRTGSEQAIGVGLIIMGLGFCMTIIGVIIGMPLMLIGMKLMGKKENVVKCKCGHVVKID
jgi:hypothetical protein